jgi:hypothetical protein
VLLDLDAVDSLLDRTLALSLKYLLVIAVTMSEVPPEAAEAAEEVFPPVEEADAASSSMIYVVGLLLAAAIGGAAYYFLVIKKQQTKEKEVVLDEVMATNSVGLKDISYIAAKLHPESSHMDVLWAVISTPESIAFGLRAFNAKEKLRRERIAQNLEDAKKGKKSTDESASMFDFDDEGWAEDEDDDMDEESRRKAKASKQAEEQAKKDKEQLEKATGKTKVLLEGLDAGVIGQNWVETTLSKKNGILEGMKFEYEGKQVSALDHPGLRRNICMIQGRLNSVILNSHPELCKYNARILSVS